METSSSLHLMSDRSRVLTPRQAQRLSSLLKATEELAVKGGYPAVTMRDVAERAGVGIATVYRYFSSKDHLISEMSARRSQLLIEELERSPARGNTPAERVKDVFFRMLEAAAAELQFAAAGVAAMTSGDAIASSADYWRRVVMTSFIDAALGDDDRWDHQRLGEVLGHLFFSLMAGLSTGRMTLEDAKSVMADAITLILEH